MDPFQPLCGGFLLWPAALELLMVEWGSSCCPARLRLLSGTIFSWLCYLLLNLGRGLGILFDKLKALLVLVPVFNGIAITLCINSE